MKERTVTCLLLAAFLLGSHPLAAQEDAGMKPLIADSVRSAWHAALADDDSARVLCTWSLRSNAGAHIQGAMLRARQRDGLAVRSLTRPAPGCEDVHPAVTLLPGNGGTAGDGGLVLVAWQRGCVAGALEGQHVYAARHDAELRPVDEELLLSDAVGLAPAAGRRTTGDAVMLWQDYRNGGADIYAQRFDRTGDADAAAVMLNDDASRALQGPPRLAADCRDEFLALWPDNREDNMWKFVASEFDGTHAGDNLLVDSAQRKAMTMLVSAVALPGDSALFAWKDYREGHSNVYLRRADLRGGALSPAVRLNDDTTDRWQRQPVLDSDGGGNVVACWEDYRHSLRNQKGDIYMQVFARGGSRIGANRRVNDDTARVARKMPRIAMLRDGSYLVVWHQGNEGNFELYGQWFRYPAERIGRNFCISCSANNR